MNIIAINTILQRIRRIDGHAIIAGGFLRDRHYGVTPKDIDIFVSNHVALADLQKLFPSARMEIYSAFLEYTSGEIDAVFDLGDLHVGFPVQVIRVTEGTPADRVMRHDFGFCQIYSADLTGLSTKSFTFFSDSASDTVTLTYCEDQQQFDRSMKRWDRLKLKYPQKHLVIPQEFQKYQCVLA